MYNCVLINLQHFKQGFDKVKVAPGIMSTRMFSFKCQKFETDMLLVFPGYFKMANSKVDPQKLPETLIMTAAIGETQWKRLSE